MTRYYVFALNKYKNYSLQYDIIYYNTDVIQQI